MSKINEIRIDQLHPRVASAAKAWLLKVESEGIKILITQSLRTIAEQDALYAQGRTKPGQVVTQVKGGYSYHNYGLALDYCLLDAQGNMKWDVNKQWRRVAEIGKQCGFEWGGDWTGFIDYPHLQMTFGLTCAELKAGKKPPSEELLNLDIDKAKFIDKVLQDYWGRMEGNKEIQDYTHECAVDFRKATGIPEE